MGNLLLFVIFLQVIHLGINYLTLDRQSVMILQKTLYTVTVVIIITSPYQTGARRAQIPHLQVMRNQRQEDFIVLCLYVLRQLPKLDFLSICVQLVELKLLLLSPGWKIHQLTHLDIQDYAKEMIQCINKTFLDTVGSTGSLDQTHHFWFKQELNLDR